MSTGARALRALSTDPSSAPTIAPTGATTSSPELDTMTTSRPAVLWAVISSTASSYTSGSMMSCNVSATTSRTWFTSHPVHIAVR